MVSTLAILAAALAAAGLSACAPGVELTVLVSSPQLRQEIVTLAAEYSRSAGLRIEAADTPRSPQDAAVTIRWSFVPSKADGATVVIPNEKVQAAGFHTGLAFEQQARGAAGWNEVPILWDAWGLASTRGASRPPGDAATFGWKDRAASIGAGRAILLPGAEPGVRQALFWFVDAPFPDERVLSGMLLGGSERSNPAALARFKSLAALGRDPVFSPGSFTLKKPDVENLARTASVKVLFGNYQWLRRIQGGPGRDFRALVYPLPQGYAMPVSVLSGTVTGSGAAAVKAQEFLLWLLSPANQKALSNATGFMAANFDAPNLDPNALGARNAAVGARRILPVDPEPAGGSAADSWDSLIGGILARPAEWQNVLAERETR